mmetsp:Transcript_2044/g.5942  ORF Transcript_2044/g.5942 Transcript_2044/m.5942 type:complete len:236 (-) Transcript_2044:391-1098(-)
MLYGCLWPTQATAGHAVCLSLSLESTLLPPSLLSPCCLLHWLVSEPLPAPPLLRGGASTLWLRRRHWLRRWRWLRKGHGARGRARRRAWWRGRGLFTCFKAGCGGLPGVLEALREARRVRDRAEGGAPHHIIALLLAARIHARAHRIVVAALARRVVRAAGARHIRLRDAGREAAACRAQPAHLGGLYHAVLRVVAAAHTQQFGSRVRPSALSSRQRQLARVYRCIWLSIEEQRQ